MYYPEKVICYTDTQLNNYKTYRITVFEGIPLGTCSIPTQSTVYLEKLEFLPNKVQVQFRGHRTLSLDTADHIMQTKMNSLKQTYIFTEIWQMYNDVDLKVL